MKTLQSGLVLLAAFLVFQLLGRGIAAASDGTAAGAFIGLLALCVSYVAGVLGLYRVLIGVVSHGSAAPAAYTIDRPVASVLRYQRGEKTMIITLNFDGRVPRLFETAIHTWESPHNHLPLTPRDRDAILHDIILYLTDEAEIIEIVRGEETKAA
jgi:hypothetical protein